MTLSAGTRFGPYVIVAEIGAGGMGEVYKARDTKLDRDVAIKVLSESFAQDPDRLARFTREAKTLASLNHPNIAHLHGFEESGGVRALVMELVPGEDLAQRLSRGPLLFEDVVAISRQIAEALEAAHDQGVIHRDLKPANVKVTAEGIVKILDFGLAKADPSSSIADSANVATVISPASHVGMIIGTAAYMSPEQARGRVVDKRTDIWAFGVVVYEMLTGRRAFAGDDVSETLAAVLRDPPPLKSLPVSTPPRMRRLLERCLDRDIRMRLRDIGEARVELATMLSDSSVLHPASTPAVAPVASHWWRAAAGLVIGGLLVWLALSASTAPASGATALVRALLNPPAGADFTDVDRPLAVSPDGSTIVVVASRRSGGRSELFVRDVTQLDWRELVGTDDAAYPFWSPDSRSVAFFATGQLKRVDLGGGIVRTLCDAPSGRGGDWNAQGLIVFAPAAIGGLSSVPDAGGAATPYSTPVDDAETQRLPRFLPDGRRVLFFSNGRLPHGLYLFDPSTKTSTFVMDSQTDARFVAPGYLAFVRDENLMLQPFDARSGKLTDDARPIATGVGFDVVRRYASFDLSAAGTLIYFPAARLPGHALSWMDRAGLESPIAAPPATIAYLDVSRDGTHAVESTTGNHGELGVSILDLTRGVLTPLPGAAPRLLGRFVDNDHVAFEQLNGNGMTLTISDLNGVNSRVVSTDRALEYNVGGASVDGSRLLYSQLSNVGKVGQLMVADLTSGQTHLLSKSDRSEFSPRISPEGHLAAYLSGDAEVAKPGARVQLAVTTFQESGPHSQVSLDGLQADSWGWLGENELYWQDLSNKVWSATVTEKDARVLVSPPKLLFGGKPLEPGLRLLAYSLSRRAFVAARPAAAVTLPQPVIISDWRAALAGPKK